MGGLRRIARHITGGALLTVLVPLAASCGEQTETPPPSDAGADAVFDADAQADMDAGDADAALEAAAPQLSCPLDMVRVLDRFCVDRYETSLVDADTSRPLSPYYPPLPTFEPYLKAREADATRLLASAAGGEAGSMGFPPLPDWQRRGRYKAKAISRKGATPNGYLMLQWAREACERAGKRLCKLDEWKVACRGEQDRKFPYGDKYEQNACNVFRENHPGNILFRNMSVGMIDPRMNKVTAKGKPLLRPTGATPSCKSEWAGDAIYDMVGNLDEWIDDPDGTFAGGFYSRSSKDGCEKVVTAHAPIYFDYSTGARCCADPQAAP